MARQLVAARYATRAWLVDDWPADEFTDAVAMLGISGPPPVRFDNDR